MIKAGCGMPGLGMLDPGLFARAAACFVEGVRCRT